MKTTLEEILTTLEKHRPKNDRTYLQFRKKCTGLGCWGHRLPVLQKIAKDGFSFYQKNEDEILKIWDHVWKKAPVHEAMYLPLFYYRNRKKSLGPKHWRAMQQWAQRVENWEHADALAYLYSIMLETFQHLVYPKLKTWNRDASPWKRRLSIVPLTYYATPRRKAPSVKEILPLVKNLLTDKDAYVQKAIGWTLRECGTLYPKETLAFLQTHARDLPSVAFSYATERLTVKQKQQLKKLRQGSRRLQPA